MSDYLYLVLGEGNIPLSYVIHSASNVKPASNNPPKKITWQNNKCMPMYYIKMSMTDSYLYFCKIDKFFLLFYLKFAVIMSIRPMLKALGHPIISGIRIFHCIVII